MLPFPYKEAITNAYGLIMVARNKILWKLWPNRSHNNTRGQPVPPIYPRGKSQRSIIHTLW